MRSLALEQGLGLRAWEGRGSPKAYSRLLHGSCAPLPHLEGSESGLRYYGCSGSQQSKSSLGEHTLYLSHKELPEIRFQGAQTQHTLYTQRKQTTISKRHRISIGNMENSEIDTECNVCLNKHKMMLKNVRKE